MGTRLRRLKVERFRDVRPGTELRFGDAWNVLLGRNGSGKTTLLHLISMVLRDDLSPLRGEEFSIEYELDRGPVGRGVVGVRNAAAESPLPGERRLVATTRVEGWESGGLRWEVVIPGGESMRVVGDDRKIAPQDPLMGARRTAALFALRAPDGHPSSGLIEWPHLSMANCYRVDEGVAMFGVITGSNGHGRVSVPSRSGTGLLGHHEGVSAIDGHFVPEAVTRRMAGTFSPSLAGVEFDLGGDALLDRCVELLGARRVTVRAESGKEDVPFSRGRWFDGFAFHAQLSPSRLVRHDHWSFGQQRMLTLFWYLACNPDVVVADEMVNGLHWEWIEACVEAIGERQVFVAAQNPLLLEHVGFASPEDVRRTFVLCSGAARGEDVREMAWVQPDQEQAERFFHAWSSGIQPVHEVLKTEGLW